MLIKKEYESISQKLNGVNNMFDYKHYVPILKWKPAEQRALEELSNEEKEFITPLIQLVMPNPKPPKDGERDKTPEEQLEEVITSFKEKIPKISEEILSYWGKNPVFLDLSLIYTSSLIVEGFDKILTAGENLGLRLIPVVNLSSDKEIKKLASSATKKYNHGLCLRLVPADFSDLGRSLVQEIHNFLETFSLSEDNIDLLVDLKDRNDKYLEYIDLSQKIPNLSKWRTFIFASGAFPVDLTTCELGENYRPRFDWKNWISLKNFKKLLRYPTFADYTIQHPIYKESLRFFAPSASIKYALANDWLIMRGSKGKNKHYIANAYLLSQDKKFKSLFRGASFSFGDKYIAEKGSDLNTEKTGNTKDWLIVGINHHLVCTIDQIANLS